MFAEEKEEEMKDTMDDVEEEANEREIFLLEGQSSEPRQSLILPGKNDSASYYVQTEEQFVLMAEDISSLAAVYSMLGGAGAAKVCSGFRGVALDTCCTMTSEF
jgi:hypothetical protein